MEMMDPILRRLRESYREFQNARQARYEQLAYEQAVEMGVEADSEEAFEMHKTVIQRIDQEMRAVEKPEGEPALVSCEAYISPEGKLYTR